MMKLSREKNPSKPGSKAKYKFPTPTHPLKNLFVDFQFIKDIIDL